MFGIVFFLFAITFGAQHHDCSPRNDQREYNLNPGSEGQETGADSNENAAEHDSADDAPVQNAMAQAIRHLEPGEYRHEYEQVVHAQDFLQGVTGYEKTCDFRAMLNVQETCKR
ncbi:hypothetical protein D3C85_1320750 [compost metagenome]